MVEVGGGGGKRKININFTCITAKIIDMSVPMLHKKQIKRLMYTLAVDST